MSVRQFAAVRVVNPPFASSVRLVSRFRLSRLVLATVLRVARIVEPAWLWSQLVRGSGASLRFVFAQSVF